MELLTLREVCELVGVSRRAVQGYEKQGIVHAVDKNKYGYLLYDEVAVQMIRQVKMYQDMGFSVKEIKELMLEPDEIRKSRIADRVTGMYEELERLKKNIQLAEELLR